MFLKKRGSIVYQANFALFAPYFKLFILSSENSSEILNTLKKYYKKANFIKILNKDKLISTNDVINTNNCNISVCKSKNKNKIIILSAIDNLIKGGAGQAIQNMNMKFNFPKDAGFK